MDTCAFDKLFTKNVPHILENIFFLLDYKSFKNCIEVSSTWKGLLVSEAYRRKAKSLFQQEILKDDAKLWKGSRDGNINEVRRLLSIGLLDVNWVDRGYTYGGMRFSSSTPLQEAVERGQREVVKVLLDNGADPDKALKSKIGDTPLTSASRSGYKDIIQLLLQKGADPNKANKCRSTPLHYAIDSKLNESVVKLLLDGGADPNKSNSLGRTPLHWAAQNGHRNVARFLLDAGADLNKTDGDGKSPLHWAAKRNHKDVIQLLVDRGAVAVSGLGIE